MPTNSRFESVGELQRVLGMTPGLMARIVDSLTTYTRQRGVNLATAPRSVLLAVPGVTPEQVDTFINDRREALANQLPVPPFPAARALASGATPAWRIHTEAVSPDGVTFARDAVVRPQSDPQKRMVVLLWQEGAAAPQTGSTPATDTTSQENGPSKL